MGCSYEQSYELYIERDLKTALLVARHLEYLVCGTVPRHLVDKYLD